MRSQGLPVQRARASRGFTMVELMVALALGLLLLGALITLVVSTVGNRSELDKTSRQIESGRYALQVLGADIEAAGFVGTTGDQVWERGISPAMSGARAFTLVACPTTEAELGYDTPTGTPAQPPLLPLAVQMLPNAVGDTTPSCLASANVKVGTGMLLLTRVSSKEVSAAAANHSEAYVQVSTCGTDSQQMLFGLGGSAFSLLLKDCTTPAPLRRAIHRIYFISTCNECAAGKDDGIPTLKVAEYSNGAMSITPLADGIDDLQFDYGVDMGPDFTGSPDCYVSRNYESTPAFVTDDATICPTPSSYERKDVVTVRISVLARTREKPTGWKDDGRTFNLGLAKPSVAIADGHKRVVYSSIARVVNISAFEERP